MPVIVSLVHSAYLRLFWHLGYEYVFTPAVQELRQSLHQAVQRQMDTPELEGRFGGFGRTMLREQRFGSWADLGMICRPTSLASFAVSVPGMEDRIYILFLPGFTGSADAGLNARLQAASGECVRVRQLVWDAPRELRLAHPDAFNWGHEFWHDALRGG